MCRITQNSFGLNIVDLTFRKAGVGNITMALAVKVSLLVAISLALLTYPCPSSGETNFQPVDSHLPIQEGLPRLPDKDSVLQDPGVSTSVPVTAKFQDLIFIQNIIPIILHSIQKRLKFVGEMQVVYIR